MASKNRELKGQPCWALVTGASAGIGREFCRQLAERGYRLVLIARRTERLEALARELGDAHGTECLVITADLSVADAGAGITARLEEASIEVDFLVNNAGYGLPGSFHVSSWQAHAAYIQLMVTSVCELTWRLLRGMQARGRGCIINVASVAGLAPASAGHTLYGASKAFLIKFSESLALENADKGVRVSALCPGFTYSEFHDVNGTRAIISKLPAYMWQQAGDVVRCALDNMSGNKTRPVLVPGRFYRFIVLMNRHLPWLVNKLMARNARHYRITE